MSTKNLLLTVLTTILAISPITVFQKKPFRVLYQCYIVTWNIFVLTAQIYVNILRKDFVLPQKIVFTILSISELFLDFSISIILCKHSRVLLKLLAFLSNIWCSKCVVIWMLVNAIHAVLALYMATISWYFLAIVYSFLRFNSTLIGLTLVFRLTKTRVKQFNQEIIKSSTFQLQTLLQAQKKLFALVDCLNQLFGVIIFWAVLTAICLALDYICFMITNPQYHKQSFHVIGYYLEVVYFEVSDTNWYQQAFKLKFRSMFAP